MFEMSRVRNPRTESIPSPDSPPASSPSVRAARRQARILMIDDEPALGEMICEFLALSGHQTRFCPNGEEALAVLKNAQFDLIISDFRMPGLSGAQLFDEIQSVAPGLARRVVFMTGDTLSVQARQFFDRHEVPCLTKPFQLPTLENFISTQLETLGRDSLHAGQSQSHY
jgi:CheY-like chemotaxis protein